MSYTPVGYTNAVVLHGKGEIAGWPGDKGIPFGDPSAILGGVPIIEYLVDLCKRGVIRFVPVSAERIALAKRDPFAVLPAEPVEPRKFQQWGRLPRNDLGKARARPKTNPLGLPLTKKWQTIGAITPKLVLDELDVAEEVESDIDTDVETEVEEGAGESSGDVPPESDPIEQWEAAVTAAAESEEEISEFEE